MHNKEVPTSLTRVGTLLSGKLFLLQMLPSRAAVRLAY